MVCPVNARLRFRFNALNRQAVVVNSIPIELINKMFRFTRKIKSPYPGNQLNYK